MHIGFNMIKLKNVSVDFPLYHVKQKTLKHQLVSGLIGGSFKNHDYIQTVQALKNINLTINNGDRLAIIGHNGSGKTTLLRVLSGIYDPTFGIVEIQGNVNSLTDINLGINEDFTGRENIKTRALIMGVKSEIYDEFERNVIIFSELSDFIDLPLRTYSSGMKVRLAFAIATFISPDILIMDEWLSTGDSNFQKKANEKLNQTISKSNIFVLSSHSNEVIKKNCNRVIKLSKGEIVYDGDLNGIKE